MRRRGARAERGERGAATLVVAGVMVMVAWSVVWLARTGAGAVARAEAQTAADAAALAAADMLALGRGAGAAGRAAGETAAANGARLDRCRCSGRVVEVAVVRALDPPILGRRQIRAVARAEIRPHVSVSRRK